MLSVAASFVLAFPAFADDVVTFRVTGSDGTVREFALDDINRLAFQEETFVMIFNNAAPDETFRYEDVLKMQFGNVGHTAVQNITDDAEGISISYDGSVLSISGCADRQIINIYDVAGRPVISQRVSGSAQIGTQQLSAGVYILKTNNKTFKFSKL